MRTALTIFLLVFGMQSYLPAQKEQKFTLIECFKLLEKQFNLDIFYQESYIPDLELSYPVEKNSFEEILSNILSNTGLAYLNYQDYAYIIAPQDRLNQSFDQAYFDRWDSIRTHLSTNIEELPVFEVGQPGKSPSGNLRKIQGFVTDDADDKAIIGASIFIEGTESGAVVNEIGKYSLSLGSGEYVWVIKAIGYIDRKIKVNVFSSGDLDLSLSNKAFELDEIVINSEATNAHIEANDIGREVFSVNEIKRLPAFMGEVDVIKTLLLLPGVSSVGEGAGGINVRGGNVDQNLVMQEGMYLFNTSHVLGLFSLFNPDIVNKVNLYKGNMPARFGGRLSSILDVELKEGNYQKFSGKGGLGLVSSRITLETPILKGKSSIILGTRFSLSDYLFDAINIAKIQESSAFFYDANLKYTHRINDKGKIKLSGYLSQDRFKFEEEFDFRWRSNGLNASFNYLISNHLSFNLEGVYSQYESSWNEPFSNRAFLLKNDISSYKVRPELNLKAGTAHNLNMGLEFNAYIVNPGTITPATPNSSTIAKDVADEQGRDIAVYIHDEFDLNAQWSLSTGLRFVFYQNLGPGDLRLYAEGSPRQVSTQTGTVPYAKGEVITSYSGFEPRVALRFGIDESASLKMSYSRTQQFINQLSNTTAVSPVDIWQLSNSYLEPLRAHNYSLGFFKNLSANVWVSSIEVFFRDIDHLIEYKDLATLLVNDHLETEVIPATGRAYGVEFSLRKTSGRYTGWFGYTYSRSERKTQSEFREESINNNMWFLSNYDRPHDLSLVLTYQANKRSHLAVNFIYSSGRPITAPSGSFGISNILNIPVYSQRNGLRIPDYHRLDVSYTVGQSHKKSQAWRSSWTYSLYNLYSRRNPYTVFYTQKANAPPQANRLSVLGSIIPSITYNFSF